MLDSRQNDLSELLKIWNQWEKKRQDDFVGKYGGIAYLLPVEVDKQMIEAMLVFWDPSYRCFRFNKEDMTPTIEEYSVLLHVKPKNSYKVYWKEQGKSKYRKKIYKVLGIEDVKKIENQGIPWGTLKKHILGTTDEELASELLSLAIYGLAIFPKILGHIEESVLDFCGQVNRNINPAPSILAETIQTLNFCRREGKGRFVGCIQLLYIWMQSHLGGKIKSSICPYSDFCVPIKEFRKVQWPQGVTKEQWEATFQNLTSENVTWKAPWMPTSSFIYRCGNNPWVPLIGLWGAVNYAPLLVRRQFRSKQFIPMTHGLNSLEFDYKTEGYLANLRKISEDWRKVFESELDRLSDKTTPEYLEWRNKRVCDASAHLQEFARPPNFPPRAILSNVNIVRQELEAKKMEWEREKTKLVEEATFAKYDTMIRTAELERTAKELEITRGDLENSKGVIKSLETEVGYAASDIKTSREWRTELTQMEKRKNAWREDSQKKKEKIGQTSQSFQQSETR
ncbi:hypothetical protein REPUB_Repub03eG0153200 [Reevesia pubescens]